MAGKPNKPGQMAVTIAMNPGASDYLEKNANGGDAALLLGQWATFWLDSQARGGVMISPEDHNYLATLNNGVRFSSGKQLVAAVERGLKRDDGQFTFPITIDPAWERPLQEAADVMGITSNQLLTEVVNTCMENGWAYSWSPHNQIIATDADYATIGAAIGKKVFFGRDVAEYLRTLPLPNGSETDDVGA
jgi:hypothetical protein